MDVNTQRKEVGQGVAGIWVVRDAGLGMPGVWGDASGWARRLHGGFLWAFPEKWQPMQNQQAYRRPLTT